MEAIEYIESIESIEEIESIKDKKAKELQYDENIFCISKIIRYGISSNVDRT